MARRSKVQDLPSGFTDDYQNLIQWAIDLGRYARETDTTPDYSKIPHNLRSYTRSAYKGYLAQVA